MNTVANNSAPRRGNNRFYVEDILIHETDKERLRFFMKRELDLYNALVHTFNNKIRLFSDEMANMPNIFVRYVLFSIVKKRTPDEFEKNYADFVGIINEEVRQLKEKERDLLKKKKPIKVQKSIVPYNSNMSLVDILNSNAYKRCYRGIIEVALCNSGISSYTQKAMVEEMFRFFATQSAIMTETKDGTYRVPPQNLFTTSIDNKRHVQLPREAVKFRFSSEDNCSYIATPYTIKEIKIPDFDITKLKWNLIILHQTIGTLVYKDTPWVVNFVRCKDKYLLKYMDQPNPYFGSYYNANIPKIYRKR